VRSNEIVNTGYST